MMERLSYRIGQSVILLLRILTSRRYSFLADEENLERFLPHLLGKSVKDILKVVRFEIFDYDPTADSLS